jgi:hypothetical protein
MGSDGVIKADYKNFVLRVLCGGLCKYLLLLREDKFMRRDSDKNRCRIVHSGHSELELL